jgi:hypothetical protein
MEAAAEGVDYTDVYHTSATPTIPYKNTTSTPPQGGAPRTARLARGVGAVRHPRYSFYCPSQTPEVCRYHPPVGCILLDTWQGMMGNPKDGQVWGLA